MKNIYPLMTDDAEFLSFFPDKYLVYPNLLSYTSEISGKTLHLLKSASKLAPTMKKSKTVPIKGTFAEYQASKQKPQPGQQQEQ